MDDRLEKYNAKIIVIALRLFSSEYYINWVIQ